MQTTCRHKKARLNYETGKIFLLHVVNEARIDMQRQAAEISAKLLQKFNQTRGDFVSTLPATMTDEFANGRINPHS